MANFIRFLPFCWLSLGLEVSELKISPACAQVHPIWLEVWPCRSELPTTISICSRQGERSGAEGFCNTFSSGIHFPLGPGQNSDYVMSWLCLNRKNELLPSYWEWWWGRGGGDLCASTKAKYSNMWLSSSHLGAVVGCLCRLWVQGKKGNNGCQPQTITLGVQM